MAHVDGETLAVTICLSESYSREIKVRTLHRAGSKQRRMTRHAKQTRIDRTEICDERCYYTTSRLTPFRAKCFIVFDVSHSLNGLTIECLYHFL